MRGRDRRRRPGQGNEEREKDGGGTVNVAIKGQSLSINMKNYLLSVSPQPAC